MDEYRELLVLKEQIMGDIEDIDIEVFTAIKRKERLEKTLSLVDKLIAREEGKVGL